MFYLLYLGNCVAGCEIIIDIDLFREFLLNIDLNEFYLVCWLLEVFTIEYFWEKETYPNQKVIQNQNETHN